MKFSQILFNSKIKVPKEEISKGAKLLFKANYIEKLGSGIYTYLHFGFKSLKKIENIIREEMGKIGAFEILMPSLHPKFLWEESGRFKTYEPPLFKVRDIHKKILVLAPTHEELITKIAKKRILSYKDLPIKVFQIQVKYRNELRAKSGILRTREFIMKDLYSFHSSSKDLDKFYKQVINSYKKIFKRCGLKNLKVVEASTGPIGGSESHEFMEISKIGEDKILSCKNCGFTYNQELQEQNSLKCKRCNKNIEQIKGIELGHTFKLGTLYAEKLEGYFIDKYDKKKPYIMGCYGIGIGRILGALAENYNDKNGLIFEKEVAPYEVYLTFIEKEKKDFAEKIYNNLLKEKIEVLYDDRIDKTPGEKFFDADLIGIPHRLVVSKKTKNKIELKLRKENKPKGTFATKEILKILKKI